MQGASPLASPRLNPRGTGSTCRCRRLNGGRAPGVAGSASVSGARRGGFPSLSPAASAFRLLFCPYPPAPLPSGKGRLEVILCKGLRPLHSQGLNPRFAAKPTEFLYLEQCRQPRRGGTGGEELRRLRWSSPPGQGEPVPLGFSSPAGTGSPAANVKFTKKLDIFRAVWYS